MKQKERLMQMDLQMLMARLIYLPMPMVKQTHLLTQMVRYWQS